MRGLVQLGVQLIAIASIRPAAPDARGVPLRWGPSLAGATAGMISRIGLAALRLLLLGALVP